MLTISDKCKHIYRNLQYIHIAFNNNLSLFHTRAHHTEIEGQIGHEGGLFRNFPVLNPPGCGGEAYADLEEFSLVADKRPCIALVLNLLQGRFGGVVNLQLDDVDVVPGLEQQVYPVVFPSAGFTGT